ncbi:hypothetical protein L226DRAFT_570961 [Lentinus tigrinus ALCF2SS1-7]|uniref:uncharacterized protein n=1 Tax=Lentinus tigrinus ALCF2SS1-7 TaxID=1328758 RepID=UPI0011662766|nr:hypothetical protein L226DRAFT_570961 [Lentinus tigrinus ALCF2SS1-7]
MSDAGRQSFTDKASAALKPDSQKTTMEHIGDMFTGKADNVASNVQPQSQKSTTQKIGDAFTSGSNSNSTSHATQPSLTQKAKNAMGLGPGHSSSNV